MNRITLPLAALTLALPLAAQAQAFRCTDATGRVLYTDKPCDGGDLVVPALTEEEQARRRIAESEALARQAAARQQALEAESLRLARERLEVERAAAAAAAQAARPQDSSACREARANADWLAGSKGVSAERLRTARYNAALACGQQPPAEVVETTTVVRPPYYDGYYGGGRYGRPLRPDTPSYGGYASGRTGAVNWGVGFSSGGAYHRAPPPPQQQVQRLGVPGTSSVPSAMRARPNTSKILNPPPPVDVNR